MPEKTRRIVFDIETNALLRPSKIWCIVCKDIDTDEKFFFSKQKTMREDFTKFAKEEVKLWIGHNIINFDIPVLSSFFPECAECFTEDNVLDTVVLSRMSFFGRAGGHGLEAWGSKLGYSKVEHEDWVSDTDENFKEILHRCSVDVDLNHKVLKALHEEMKGRFSKLSVQIEMSTAWACERIQRHGFYLDMPKAIALRDSLLFVSSSLREEMERHMPKKKRFIRTSKLTKKDGSCSAQYLRDLENPSFSITTSLDGTMYDVYEETPFNPDSPSQCVAALDEAGWRPTDKTKSGKSYKVNEVNLLTLPENAPKHYKVLRDYKIASTRYKVVQAWIDSAEQYGDGRVHGKILHIGTHTHRMAHSDPNMGNVASTRAMYGRESRECLTVPHGYKLLGTDAKGIQLRLLAHFINDPEYTEAVVNGDPHTKNMFAAGIDKGEWDEEEQKWSGRSVAKTFIYTWLMNGGDELIGKICNGNGREIKQRFLDNLPGLKKFRESHRLVAKVGYAKLFDGRSIRVDDEHYVMPTYLQGGETIVMKLARMLWEKEARDKGLDFKLVAWVHDEWQTEVKEEHAEELAKIQRWSLQEAGKMLDFNCPMDGDPKVGNNWAETH